jgi:hypothetical protein
VILLVKSGLKIVFREVPKIIAFGFAHRVPPIFAVILVILKFAVGSTLFGEVEFAVGEYIFQSNT